MAPEIAYIVIAHRNAAQAGRLVRRLATDQARFLIHADKRAGTTYAHELRAAVDGVADVTFLERNACFWGGFGMVEAILKGLTVLVDEDAPCHHAIVLSGQDYPLVPAFEIERFLAASPDASYMTHTRLPSPFWPRGGLDRVEHFHVVSYRALHLRLPWRRRVPGGLVPFGGGAWMTLARPAVAHVVDYVRSHSRVVRFFRHALHPDELFFQTILLNSPLAESVVDDHLRHIEWRDDPGSPAIFRAPDRDALIASGKLFARKFDASVDETILDLLDEHIEARSLHATG
jgi:hypothetical protein